MKYARSIALSVLASTALCASAQAQHPTPPDAPAVARAPEPRTAMMGVGLQPIPPMLAAHLPEEARGGLVLSDVRIEEKSGGRSGTWTRDATPESAGEAP